MRKRKEIDFTRVILAGAIAFIAGLFSQTVAAAEDAEYLAEFQLYSEALQNGDVAAAETHGFAAWEAAERELGDHKLTAILAYNYGQLMLFTNTDSAQKALRRADQLQEAGIADLPVEKLGVYLAYTEFEASEGRRRQANDLRKALNALDAAGVGGDRDIAAIRLTLAWNDIHNERYRLARDSAAMAEATIEASMPGDYSAKAQAILIGGVAKLVPYPRKIDDVIEAHDDFLRARRLFPPQKDFDSFDQTLAQIIAWNAAAGAAVLSLGVKRSENLETTPLPPLFETYIDAPEDCGFDWAERRPPKYPARAGRRGYIGAVMAVYDANDDGAIRNPRILSEVPLKTFSDAVLRSIKTWRLKSPPVDHPSCRKNIMTQFTFVIEE